MGLDQTGLRTVVVFLANHVWSRSGTQANQDPRLPQGAEVESARPNSPGN
jgi:hypothetical protein